ncbi:MAG: nucleotidyltransferase domain-containing protein [Acidobacteriaceae bacterium]
MVSTLVSHKAGLVELCREYHVRRLEAFGSATGWQFDPEHSDYDFLVEFGDLPPGEYANAFFGFKERLEALLGRPVDLVIPSAVRNPFFLQGIEPSRALLYAA